MQSTFFLFKTAEGTINFVLKSFHTNLFVRLMSHRRLLFIDHQKINLSKTGEGRNVYFCFMISFPKYEIRSCLKHMTVIYQLNNDIQYISARIPGTNDHDSWVQTTNSWSNQDLGSNQDLWSVAQIMDFQAIISHSHPYYPYYQT